MKKKCPSCGELKPASDYYKNSVTKSGLQSVCKVCHRKMVDQYQQADYPKIKAKAKGYYHKNLEENRMKARERYQENKGRQRKYRLGIKQEVLTHYGNGVLACVRCGFDDIRALSIDHIEGNGAEEKRKLHKVGVDFYNYLRRVKYPTGYQTLCMNCQFIKRAEGKEYNQWTTKQPLIVN